MLTYSMQKGSVNIRALFRDRRAHPNLMLGSPPDIDSNAGIAAVRGVEGVADVHYWQMEEHAVAFDTHVVVETEAWDRLEEVKHAIKRVLEDQFDITHSTLEFEREDQVHRDADLYGHGVEVNKARG